MAAKHPMKKRKYRSGLFGKLLIVIAAVAAVIVGVMIFFKVQTITITGNVRYSVQQIEEMAGVAVGENLMTLSKGEISQNIHTGLPYVQDVRIDRRLPDTVLIEVIECEAVAVVSDESGHDWLINSQCKVLERVTAETDVDVSGLTEIVGVVALAPVEGQPLQLMQQEQFTALEQLLGALEKTTLLPGIRSVNLERTYEIVLFYEQRFEVWLGGTDELEYKARYLEEIITVQLEPSKTGIIDLTLEEAGVARLIPW